MVVRQEKRRWLGHSCRVSLLRNPRVGATWEGVVIEECIRQMGQTMTPYFWRTSNGAELDLLLIRGDTRIGIEVKRTDAAATRYPSKSTSSQLPNWICPVTSETDLAIEV